MRRLLTVVVLALVLAVAGLQSAEARRSGGAYGPGSGSCDGSCYGQENEEISGAWQQFQEETADLREKLFDLRVEYADVLDQDNPDKEEANRIWSEMFDIREQLQKKASDAGFGPGSANGRGFGSRGGCNGGRWQ